MIREFLLFGALLATGLLAFEWVRQASFSSSLPGSEPAQPANQPAPLDALDDPMGDQSSVEPVDQEPIRRLLIAAANRLESGDPLQAKLRYQLDWFNQRLSGHGFLIQAGQGSGRWRIDLATGSSPNTMLFRQVANQRYYHRIENVGDDQSLAFVDLQALADAVPPTGRHASQNPWTQIGGLASLLRHLAEHFEFESPRQATWNERSVVSLVGRWDPAAMAELFPHIQTPLSNEAAASGMYDELPEHVPHAVQLLLGEPDQALGLFPFRLVFYRFQEADADASADVLRRRLKPVVTFEFFDVQHLASLQPSVFHVQPTISGSTDLTAEYIEQAVRLTNWHGH